MATIKTNNMEIVSLELAKRLKSEGFSKPTEYYYQDIDLPFSPRGLKRMKNSEEMNHNICDDFIYSAPLYIVGIDWCAGKTIEYASTLVIKLSKNN